MQIIPTEDFDTVEDALDKFLELAGEQGKVVSSSALACAGPVVDNVCDMTNLQWVVDGNAISEKFGMRTAVRIYFVAFMNLASDFDRQQVNIFGCSVQSFPGT